MLPDWPRAHGDVLASVVLKRRAQDFAVDEVLGFEPAGDGEHDLLLLEKTDTNTAWLARQLARHAGIPARDVGYCGLKDRRSVSSQWFSVRRPSGAGTDWRAFDLPGVRLVRHARHDRKLRPGSHAANRFRIVLYPAEPQDEAFTDRVAARLSAINSSGVPNYFGAQRFGRDGANVDLARQVFGGRRVRREQRSIAISAARSWLFNESLARRVRDGSWNRLLPGDLANLDGTASVFDVDDVGADLVERLEGFDIHPALSLWGEGAPRSSGAPAAIEREVATQHAGLAEGLVSARVAAASRPTRLVPHDLSWTCAPDRVELQFTLRRGEFATTLLREIFATREPDQLSSSNT